MGVYVTREEWERSEHDRRVRDAAAMARECDQREAIHRVEQKIEGVADKDDIIRLHEKLDIVVGWMNQQIGAEESRAAAIKEFKAVKDWVDGIKHTAINFGKIAGLIIALFTLWKLIIPFSVHWFEHVFHIVPKSGQTP